MAATGPRLYACPPSWGDSWEKHSRVSGFPCWMKHKNPIHKFVKYNHVRKYTLQVLKPSFGQNPPNSKPIFWAGRILVTIICFLKFFPGRFLEFRQPSGPSYPTISTHQLQPDQCQGDSIGDILDDFLPETTGKKSYLWMPQRTLKRKNSKWKNNIYNLLLGYSPKVVPMFLECMNLTLSCFLLPSMLVLLPCFARAYFSTTTTTAAAKATATTRRTRTRTTRRRTWTSTAISFNCSAPNSSTVSATWGVAATLPQGKQMEMGQDEMGNVHGMAKGLTWKTYFEYSIKTESYFLKYANIIYIEVPWNAEATKTDYWLQ